MTATLRPIVASDADVRRAAEAEFDRLTATHGTVKRRSAEDTAREMAAHRAAMDERCQDVKDWARPIVEAGAYSHRDALLADLTRLRMDARGPLERSEVAMLRIAAIELWPDHARAHGLDVRAIAEPRPTLVGGRD